MDVDYTCLLVFVSVYTSVLAHSSAVVLGMGPRALTLLMPCVLLGMVSCGVVDMVAYH